MPIKEYREFFLRHTKVTSGTKADKQIPYPLKYFIGSTEVYNRFLKGDFPTEDIFKKLFESQTFKLNQEDTAKLTEQGLAKIAGDDKASTRTSNSSNDFSAFIVPHQLPDTILDSTVNDTIISTSTVRSLIVESVKRVFGTGPSSYYRRVFRVSLVGDLDTPGNNKFYGTDGAGNRQWRDAPLSNVDKSITINSNKIELVNDESNPGNNKYYGTDGAGDKGFFPIIVPIIPTELFTGLVLMYNGNTVPTGWALCDGNNGTPDLRGRFIVATGQDSTPATGDLNPSYSLGNKGGENTHKLNYNELPKHSHRTPIYRAEEAGSGVVVASGTGIIAAEAVFTSNNEVYDDHDTPTEGSYSRHENRVPYYALTFIMKL